MRGESQSDCSEFSRVIDQNISSFSRARDEAKTQIQKLEIELLNSFQEIDYIRDQLNARNAEVYSLGEYAHELELKLADMENLQEIVVQLKEDLERSNSDNLLLMEELENKAIELQKSSFCIEKLEESMSSLTLDSQCEIESLKLDMMSLKLDMMSLEQAYFEAKKAQEGATQEQARLNALIKQLETRIHNADGTIESLEKENKNLKEKFVTSEVNGRLLLQKLEEWLENKDRSELNVQVAIKSILKELGFSEKVLVQLFSKLASAPDMNLKEQLDVMAHQISEYEVVVTRLKEELREEKVKAKEEAEDLAQEMAELRYRMTGLLEEECKRRAFIEQASLQRIAELEEEIQNERRKASAAVRHLHGA